MDSLSNQQLSHHQYHSVLLKACFDLFSKELSAHNEEVVDNLSEGAVEEMSHTTFLGLFEDVLDAAENHNPELEFRGQQLVETLMRHYPHLTHLFSRDLLWFFGGDCLHHLTDAEILGYQQLDELQYQAMVEGKPFNRIAARSFVFKPPQSSNTAKKTPG